MVAIKQQQQHNESDRHQDTGQQAFSYLSHFHNVQNRCRCLLSIVSGRPCVLLSENCNVEYRSQAVRPIIMSALFLCTQDLFHLIPLSVAFALVRSDKLRKKKKDPPPPHPHPICEYFAFLLLLLFAFFLTLFLFCFVFTHLSTS